jgi:hypothetical protein
VAEDRQKFLDFFLKFLAKLLNIPKPFKLSSFPRFLPSSHHQICRNISRLREKETSNFEAAAENMMKAFGESVSSDVWSTGINSFAPKIH